MRLSELGSEAEKSYKQKCIDLLNKTNEELQNLVFSFFQNLKSKD